MAVELVKVECACGCKDWVSLEVNESLPGVPVVTLQVQASFPLPGNVPLNVFIHLNWESAQRFKEGLDRGLAEFMIASGQAVHEAPDRKEREDHDSEAHG